MSSARGISFEQIRSWVKVESSKGRPMQEIVAELATRKDVTLLSVHDSPEVTHQKQTKEFTRFYNPWSDRAVRAFSP